MDMGNGHSRNACGRVAISCRIDHNRGRLRAIRCPNGLRQKTATMDDALRRDHALAITLGDRLLDTRKRMFAE
jgi:hypothetical protein